MLGSSRRWNSRPDLLNSDSCFPGCLVKADPTLPNPTPATQTPYSITLRHEVHPTTFIHHTPVTNHGQHQNRGTWSKIAKRQREANQVQSHRGDNTPSCRGWSHACPTR